MESLLPEGLSYSDVKYLPIVKHFAQKINLVDTIDTMVNSQMELSPGIAILAMVLDTLSGRTALYRLEEFFFEKDTELLLGTDLKPERFSDYNLGCVLDKIHQTGTQKVFSSIAQKAMKAFDIDAKRVHFDTTSASVHGDYDYTDEPFHITYGHSQDKGELGGIGELGSWEWELAGNWGRATLSDGYCTKNSIKTSLRRS